MTNRERVKAILNYKKYDRLPIVHFGFWPETLVKWEKQGHLTTEQAGGWVDGNDIEKTINNKLGFDFNWYTVFNAGASLNPFFERRIVEELPDGCLKVVNCEGVVVLEKPGIVSIPSEIDHLLKDRKSWEEHYRSRLQYTEDRIDIAALENLKNANRDYPLGLHLGSLMGQIRDWLGVEGISYLYMDDEALFNEIIDTVAQLSLKCAEKVLSVYSDFDFAHFWEDICFKNGPLVIPSVFDRQVGPYYKQVTDMVKSKGIEIVSLDCDGLIDALIPTWLKNGVNTMFPIEVGTWNASIRSWREKYGEQIRGVGGMRKALFAADYAAIDIEVERLKSLVALGGYIPCPDHRIAPDAKWENVQYYCQKMRAVFG